MRTAAAAERFAQQSNERVLSPAEAEVIASLANDTAHALAAPNAHATVTPTQVAPRAPATKVDATTAKVSTEAIAETNTVASVNLPPSSVSPAIAQNAAADSATPVVTNAATTSPASPPVAPPAPAAPPAAKVEEAATASADSKPALKWKDGNYTGYGTSRHGDIEVYLETDGGKISYIKISQCLTQYSCSWISQLPRQVMARQGPNVDGVSGATQSVNAFYYAVVEALSKAK